MALRFPQPRNCRIAILVTAGAILVTAVMMAAPTAVFAENDPRVIPPPKAQKKLPEAPSKLPKVGADRTRGLDFLFGALKAAPDEASAKHVEARIWALWLQTPSDTAALLRLRPDYIEGWNRRATLYYLKNDYTHSLEDIQQVLIREPRHFGALAGLGMIMQEIGDDKRALDAFRKALVVNPHLEKVPELVKSLTEKVEGRDI